MTTKTLLSFVRRAVQDYDMIRPHEKIAVAVSGGKDSLLLLAALAELSRFYPTPFTLHAIHIDLGFDSAQHTQLRRLCEQYAIPLTVERTEIGRIIFEERAEKNPCSLCAKMRRGALARVAQRLGCTALALGHHKNDVVETLLLNLFYSGSISTFEPKSYLDRSELMLIRPLIYLEEKDIVYYCNKHGICADKSACPADTKTRREDMKALVTSLSKENRDLVSKMFGAICRAEVSTFRETEPFRGAEKPTME